LHQKSIARAPLYGYEAIGKRLIEKIISLFSLNLQSRLPIPEIKNKKYK
jgi:hypothetical protein